MIVQLSCQDIIDLYELREALEVYAIGKAAKQPAQQADLTKLRNFSDEILVLRDELVESARQALTPEELHRFVGCDLGFHTVLMGMAANARIFKVVNETRLLIRIFAMRHKGHEVEELAQIYRQHVAPHPASSLSLSLFRFDL